MKGNTEITNCLERPTVQLVDCGQHLLHIVGQITLIFKLIPRAERKVKVLINTDIVAHKIAYLGPMLKKNLVSLWYRHADGQEIPRSPAPTVERYSKQLEAKDSTSKTSLPTANFTFTVRLLITCGDWSQVQGKEFLFEPDCQTLQKFELDAESSLVKCDSTIALRVHNYSYSATFSGKDMVLDTVEPCELVPTAHSQGSAPEQGEEKAKVITGQVDIATPTLLTQLWINLELPKEVQQKVQDHLIMSADLFALELSCAKQEKMEKFTRWLRLAVDC